MKKNVRQIILGVEEIMALKNKQNNLYGKYSNKIAQLGYNSELRVKREDGKLIFYIEVIVK